MRNFKYCEFDSPDLEGSGEGMNQKFLDMLDEARDLAGISFKINSGYRTLTHNESVGGSINSSHTRGLAADIHCNNSRSRFIILDSLISVGFSRIGISDTFIHVDLDNDKVREVAWLY